MGAVVVVMGETLSASVLAGAFDALLFVATALFAAAVFAEALRAGRPFYLALGWAFAVLYLPHVFLPLYVVYMLWRRTALTRARRRAFARWAGPPAVLLTVTLLVGFYSFRRDRNSFDARVERAGAARLRGDREEAAAEYQAALRLRPADGHTRKLLGLELSAARRWPAALEQLQRARALGDEDAALDFYAGRALEELRRAAEAAQSYQNFLRGESCVGELPDARCQTARERLAAMK